MRTNIQLQRDVMDELQFEPSVNASNIGVIAKDGIITLTGKVNNYAEKYAASEAAERVAGVKAVIDETKVDLPLAHQRDDQDIAQAALNALKSIRWFFLHPLSDVVILAQRRICFACALGTPSYRRIRGGKSS